MRLHLWADLAGRAPARGEADLLFVHAEVRDAHGTPIAAAWENVAFGATGGVALVGANPLATDAGISSILARTGPGSAPGAVYAVAIVRAADGARVLGASALLTGGAVPFELRFTADGSEPGPRSPRFVHPVAAGGPVRAALVAGGRVLAALDERTPRYRVPASAPPEAREPFRHG